MEMVIWKKIDGYNYEVSEMGDVRNIATGKLIKPRKNGKGYYFVTLCNDEEKWQVKTSRLVAKTFLDGVDGFELVDHRNGDKSDNRVQNLRWADAKQNARNKEKNHSSNSNFKGCTFDKKKQKWRVRIKIDGKSKHLGYFTNEEDAGKTYEKYSKELFGAFAFHNR